MSDDTYTPPRVWKWDKENGGAFASINRPIAGSTHDKDLPVGKHPLQLYYYLLLQGWYKPARL